VSSRLPATCVCLLAQAWWEEQDVPTMYHVRYVCRYQAWQLGSSNEQVASCSSVDGAPGAAQCSPKHKTRNAVTLHVACMPNLRLRGVVLRLPPPPTSPGCGVRSQPLSCWHLSVLIVATLVSISMRLRCSPTVVLEVSHQCPTSPAYSPIPCYRCATI
jgi:hypothetical protein